MTNQDISDVVIVGGGLNGMTLALALAQCHIGSTIVDAQPEDAQKSDAFDGRAYALALTSKRLLEALGLWAELAPNAQPMLDIVVTDGRAGEGAAPWFMHFDHAEIEEGPMGFMVEDRHLRPALLNAVERAPLIRLLPGRTVVAQQIAAGSALVELDDGERLMARLLIGADGRQSGTARRAGIERTEWGYDQTALVCAVAHERPHNATAHQFFMPSGPLAILPLAGNRSSIVWTETTARATELVTADDETFLTALRPAFGDFLGEISLAGERFSYLLGLSLAQSLTAGRLALVGDAAHGVHPLAGQGLNAGLKDVAALTEVLAEARRRGEDLGAVGVLERYGQWRRADIAALALATDAFNRLFSNDNPLLRLGRDIGMGLIGSVPALRRGLIREAAGLTGDLPALLQGRTP